MLLPQGLLYNLLLKKFSNKIAKTAFKEMSPLTKYLEFCFSSEQIITSPTRTTDRTTIHIDHVQTNSSHKVNQLDVIDLGLSDHSSCFAQEKHFN